MNLTRIYTWIASVGLLLQGTFTLLARLVPAVDQAVPQLLVQTQMIPSHSLLHIASGVVGLYALRRPRGTFWFALLFGAFYLGLALAGSLAGVTFGLGLQPFDHPFHLVLGGAGLLAAAIDTVFSKRREH
jgi:Domain of unknown function (DUF4383)